MMDARTMRVGAILFDASGDVAGSDRTVISLTSGWASIGGSAAFRVRSIHDLPSDVLWLTNLSYNAFFSAGLTRHANFRNESWLRTTFQQLAAELGVEPGTTPIDTTVEVIADVAQRTVMLGRMKFGVTPKGNTLNGDFATALQAPRSQLPDHFYSIFDTIAAHPWVSVIQEMNFAATSLTVTVRRNRLVHATDLLSTPVPPDTGWELEKSLSPTRGDHWLESVSTPFLVKATISNVQPIMAEILSWGSGSRSVRDWLTDIEWRLVRQYAEITVHEALICAKPAFRLPQADLLPAGEYAALSITSGLVAEQMWTAMTIKRPYKGQESRHTAAAAWLRAKDRMVMFERAQKLYARGLNVMGYGTGNIIMRYPEMGLRNALDISTDVGLMPPTSKFAEAAMGLERA